MIVSKRALLFEKRRGSLDENIERHTGATIARRAHTAPPGAAKL